MNVLSEPLSRRAVSWLRSSRSERQLCISAAQQTDHADQKKSRNFRFFMARSRLFFHSHSKPEQVAAPCRSKSYTLWGHPERLITFKSSALCRHLDESTGRSDRYYRCEISLRSNVESRR